MLRAFTVRKRADGLSTLIFVCKEHVVETLMAESLEEPFTEEAAVERPHFTNCYR